MNPATRYVKMLSHAPQIPASQQKRDDTAFTCSESQETQLITINLLDFLLQRSRIHCSPPVNGLCLN